MAGSSICPPARCAQTNTAFTCSGSDFRGRLQLVDQARHDAVEERLLRLVVEPHRLAAAQAPHDFGARQFEHVLATADREKVPAPLSAGEMELFRPGIPYCAL